MLAQIDGGFRGELGLFVDVPSGEAPSAACQAAGLCAVTRTTCGRVPTPPESGRGGVTSTARRCCPRDDEQPQRPSRRGWSRGSRRCTRSSTTTPMARSVLKHGRRGAPGGVADVTDEQRSSARHRPAERACKARRDKPTAGSRSSPLAEIEGWASPARSSPTCSRPSSPR